MIDHNILNLVDNPVITAANDAVNSAKAKLAMAATALATQNAVRNRAARAAESAIASLSPNAADLNELLTAEDRKLAVMERVHAAAAQAHQNARDAAEAAVGVAHRPVYSYGVELRIAASKAADAARQALKDAEAQRHAANELLQYAVGNGCPEVCYGKWRDITAPLTFNSEFSLWTNGAHPGGWFPGVNADGTIRGAA